MQNHNVKTKTAMLLELESIKGLLLEDDDIPILQEMIESQETTAEHKIAFVQDMTVAQDMTVVQDVIAIQMPKENSEGNYELVLVPTTTEFDDKDQTLYLEITSDQDVINEKDLDQPQDAVTTAYKIPAETYEEQQQDFFGLPENNISPELYAENISTPATNTIGLTTGGQEPLTTTEQTVTRMLPPKATGQNPFLPEHIRARLHGNNPPPLFTPEHKSANTFGNQPTSINPTAINPTAINPISINSQLQSVYAHKTIGYQQQLIEEVMDSILPDIEKELRERLEKMSKRMLIELLSESKK